MNEDERRLIFHNAVQVVAFTASEIATRPLGDRAALKQIAASVCSWVPRLLFKFLGALMTGES